MGLRTWVKRRFGKKDVQPMSYALRPDPFAQIPQTIDRVFDDEKNEWSPVEEPAGNSVELAEQWFNSGLQKGMQGDMLGSIQDWEKAIEIKPDHHKAWYNRGISLYALGRKEEAIASYDKAIEFKPDFHEAWFGRGISLSDLGPNEEAIDSYDKAIEIKPDHHEAWYNRGISLYALGRKEEAIASYDKAIEFKPDFHEAWYNRGISLHSLGRNEEAIASYDKAIEFKPDYHEAWYNRASCICSASQNTSLKSDIAAFIRHQKIYALRQPQPHLFALKEALPHFQEGTIGWGKIHQYLGDAQVKHTRLRTQKEDYREAVRCYKIALSCFPIESHALDYLEVIQSIVRTLLRLNAIPAARHYQTQGSPLYETLRTQAQNKRTFEAKFSTFRLTEIDLLIGENEPTRALQQAEFYKNRALTWLLDPPNPLKKGEQEPELDPSTITTDPHQLKVPLFKGDLGGSGLNENRWQSLSDRESIVYWHQSTDRITTFILTNDNAEPIVLDCDRQQQYKRFIVWKDKWDRDYDDYRSKKSATQSDHPWRQQMCDRLKQLAEILEIDAIQHHLKNTETLILIPHRDLHRYPIHALFDRPTTHAPSLQSIDRASHPAPSSDRSSLVLINDPDRSSRLPDHHPMPFAQIESTIIQQLIEPNATHINHTNATHNTIIQQLTQAKPSLFPLHRTC